MIKTLLTSFKFELIIKLVINKEKLPLLVGILIPIGLVVLVFAYSFIPTLLVKPQYDFLYAKQDYDDSKVQVISGKLTITESERDSYDYYEEEDEYSVRSTPDPEIYYYSVSTSTSKRVSIDEAMNYKLLGESNSPDGFRVGRNSSGGSVFPFYFSDEDDGLYLLGKGLKKKVGSDYYLKFVGWVDK